MKTKFYNAMRKEYDPETHYAIENWTDTGFSADEYAKVYFRIDCPAFDCVSASFVSASAREDFYAEASAVLRSFNIDEGTGYIMRGEEYRMEHLHIHPQEISGVVAKNKIVAIAEAINRCKCAFCRSVDVYEDVSNMTNEQFTAQLNEKRADIENDILSAFTTKRKNLYYGEYAASGLLERIAAKYHICRRQCESGTDYTAKAVCADVLEQLVEQGKIVTAAVKDGTGYRTAKKGDKVALTQIASRISAGCSV